MEEFSGFLAWLSILGFIIASILGIVHLAKHKESKSGRYVAIISLVVLILSTFIVNVISKGFVSTLSGLLFWISIVGLIIASILGLVHINKKQKSKTGRKTAIVSFGILFLSMLISIFIPTSNSTKAKNPNNITTSKKQSHKNNSKKDHHSIKVAESKKKAKQESKSKEDLKEKAQKESEEKSESIAKKKDADKKAKQKSKQKDTKRKDDNKEKTALELFNEMDSNPKELSKYNAGLAKELISDQNDADTVNAYAWSKFVDTTEYVKNRGYHVDVNSSFLVLSDKAKKSVINSSQDFATSEFLFMDKNLSPNTQFTNTSIYYNGQRIGHSKLTNEADFKWKK